MKLPLLLVPITLASLAAALIFHQRANRAEQLAADRQTELARLQNELATLSSNMLRYQGGLTTEQNKAQTQELVRLRGEVTQLKTESRAAAQQKVDLERTRAELQRLRGANAAAAAAAAATPPPSTPGSQAGRDHFPKEAWSFSGYESPEAALLSTVWSMQQGDPQTYYNSLTPAEQERMLQQWEGKTLEEIAASHKKDTDPIKQFRILERANTSENELRLKVFVDGVNMLREVAMQRVEGEWKFGGFLPDPPKSVPVQPLQPAQ